MASKLIAKGIRYSTLPQSYVGREPQWPAPAPSLEVINNNSDENSPVVGGDRPKIGDAYRSQGSYLQAITPNRVSGGEVEEKKDLFKFPVEEKKDMMKPLHYSSSDVPCSPTTDANHPHTLKLFGRTICAGPDLGCNYGVEDYLLSPITCGSSTSLKRKRSNFTSVQPSFSSPPPWLTPKEIPPPGISLEMSLLHEPYYKIRKKLCKSDIGNNCRLLVPRKDAKAHIMPFMNNENKEAIESEDGMNVTVVDMDEKLEHNLVFKYLSSMNCYILRKGWKRKFVKEGGLQQGDEVGLCWDITSQKFHFAVLCRAVNQHRQV